MRRSCLTRAAQQRAARPGLAALAAILFLVLAACSSPPPVVLTGTITDAYTGEPIDAADISIGETMLTSGADGGFATPEWDKEDMLLVSAPSYEPVTIALAEQPEVAASTAQTITLDTALRPNTLAGVITDNFTGDPLAGVELQVTVDVSTTLTAVTDAQGRYELAGVPETYTLEIVAPDYAPLSQDLARTTTFDGVLRPNTLTGTIVDRYTNQPVGHATVEAGSATTTTAEDGSYKLTDIPEDVDSVAFSADGYAELTQPLEETTTIDVVLRPDTLQGTLVDAVSGEPVRNAAIIATATLSSTDVAFTRITGQADGSFTLDDMPESGYVQVLAPGYSKAVIAIEPGKVPATIELAPFNVKALYITAAVASVPSLVEEYLALIETTELNAIVIDLKSDLRDDLGLIYYDSKVPIVDELGTDADYVDMAGLVAEAKRRGIYTIARVQLFSHDNALADARPDWAIQWKDSGEVYADLPGPGIRYAWLDPWDRNVWDYNIQLGVEAALMGFDEINYDYIRYPDMTSEQFQQLKFDQPTDPAVNPDEMQMNIATFMEQAHRAMNGAGAYFSVDVFGRVVLGPSKSIAQNLDLMGYRSDYVAPMPYPSLWWSGVFDVEVPVREPYKVLYGATEAGYAQMADHYARLRPWLQDHTDPWAPVVVKYGPAEVRAQIDAVEDFGKASGWMLYDSANIYAGAFGGAVKPEP
jgi:hypothetical protein